ncbi:hypothetical protein CB1_000444017 [Camelus ferus]|nr:hypothetical protein CB1_000444017 [Camelus ferus]
MTAGRRTARVLHHRSRLSDEPQQPLGLGWARRVYRLLTWGCPGAGAQRSSHGSAHATPASHLMMKRVPSFCSLSSMFGDALLHKFKWKRICVLRRVLVRRLVPVSGTVIFIKVKRPLWVQRKEKAWEQEAKSKVKVAQWKPRVGPKAARGATRLTSPQNWDTEKPSDD